MSAGLWLGVSGPGSPRLQLWWVAVVLSSWCLTCVPGQPQVEQVSYPQVEQVSYPQPEPVSVKWGLPDSVATVGRLFQLHIPQDAFTGQVLSYKVQGASDSPLPLWLEFDPLDNILQGIPTPQSVGHYLLVITAQGRAGQATTTSSLFVREEPTHSGLSLRFRASDPEVVSCSEKEPITVATVVVDTDLETLAASDSLSLFRKFISHLGLHKDMIRMLPVGKSPIQDSSALVSGAGDSTTPRTSGLFISWSVGCGQVKDSHFPALQKLDEDSSSGRLAKVLGHSIMGWHVTNSHFQAVKRKRRQVQATPTPAVTPIVPSTTETKLTDRTDETEAKMTHPVVITQSPTFIQPTATQTLDAKTAQPDWLLPVHVAGPETTATVDKITPKPKPQTGTKSTKPLTTPKPKSIPEVDIPEGCIPNQKPDVTSHMPTKNAFSVGEIIDFTIPENAFEDCETGGTRGLELILYKNVGDIVPSDYFLQLDSKHQKIIGMPLEGNLGRHKFRIVGKKSANLEAAIDFIIQIKGRSKRNINHKFSVTLDSDFQEFMGNVTDRVYLTNKIAALFGETTAKNIIIAHIEPGSVVYSWANSSLASKDCPAQEVAKLASKFLKADGSLNKKAVQELKPFVLKKFDVEPEGACVGDPEFPVFSQPKPDPAPKVRVDEIEDTEDVFESDKVVAAVPDVQTDETKEDTEDVFDIDEVVAAAPGVPETEAKEEQGIDNTTDGAVSGKIKEDRDNVWITTVVPAVVVVSVLLIALLIACILYRKKQKGKMHVEEQNTFVNKGTPVIFPDELEDKPSDVHKPLLVEGSSSPPPQYRRAVTPSAAALTSDVRNNRSNLTHRQPGEPPINEMPERPYEPPPPVTTSYTNKQPRMTTQQPYPQPPQILP